MTKDDEIKEPNEQLVRRIKVKKKDRHLVWDAATGNWHPHPSNFEPYLFNPARPDRLGDEYLSVGVASSLRAAGLPLTWQPSPPSGMTFQPSVLAVANYSALGLWAASLPLEDNPHHAGIIGLVERREDDPVEYERTITALAKASALGAEGT